MKILLIKKKTVLIFLVLVIFIVSVGILLGALNQENECVTTLYLPIIDKVIAVDAGHGGFDPGAVGKSGENEDDINLKIVLKLKKLIEQSGGIVVLTRDEDKGLITEKSKTYRQKKNEDLRNRRILINDSDVDIFVSIHLNSFPMSSCSGAQTFYKDGCEKSKLLADIIQKELKNIIDNHNNRLPQSRRSIYIIREVKAPSVLVECGFLSNSREEKLLNTPQYQEKIAWSIYIGLMKYFKEIEGLKDNVD